MAQQLLQQNPGMMAGLQAMQQQQQQQAGGNMFMPQQQQQIPQQSATAAGNKKSADWNEPFAAQGKKVRRKRPIQSSTKTGSNLSSV
jgi:hypothetical protein